MHNTTVNTKFYNKPSVIKLSKRVQDDFDDEGVELPQQEMGYFVKVNHFHEYSIPIDSDFGAPSQYRSIVQMLLNASESDTVELLFNSRGGRLDGLQTLLEAIKITKAETTAVLMGECASAASILALHCNNVHVTDSASMLCHHLSLHVGGKHNDVVAHLEHITRTSLNLMRSAYEGFLSEQELAEMIKGREIYLDASEIVEHLEARQEYWEEQERLAKAEQGCNRWENEEGSVELPPEPTTAKSKKTKATT